ncbi:MAG: extensin family protein [Deltaproteobacteria bacterium]|nr:extensin family protein [Deltaproteobacteria bacterium]
MWCAAVLALAAGRSAAQDAEQAPWYAPWRAIAVRTPEDAERAWAMVREFFGNMRQGHAHEVWETDRERMPPARPLEECLAALAADGRDWPRADRACRMSAQVRIAGPVEGVAFQSSRRSEAIEVGCELAIRLPELARLLRESGVARVRVGPPARFSLKSYHRFGLALDVYALTLDDGTELVVEDDYELQGDRETCAGAEPDGERARVLREVACRLFEAHVLSTVITPNYNAGHRNHFHWDVRPGDERFYLR